jgi:hypothetical protein
MIWTATVGKGLRIATGRDAAECMGNAEFQIGRLAAAQECLA